MTNKIAEFKDFLRVLLILSTLSIPFFTSLCLDKHFLLGFSLYIGLTIVNYFLSKKYSFFILSKADYLCTLFLFTIVLVLNLFFKHNFDLFFFNLFHFFKH